MYHILGTYRVNSELKQREKELSRMVGFLLQIYRMAFILCWFLLALWVYMDARHRSTNAAAWGILTLLTSVVGWAVYLVARPLLIVCLVCGQEQIQGLVFCTTCGAALKTCCPQCASQLQEDWDFCGSCGQQIIHE